VDAFDFVVAGIPASAQKKGPNNRWQDRVRKAARTRWPRGAPPITEELSATIVYFYVDETNLDVDNIPKAILDALVNVVYTDDALVSQVLVRKTKLEPGLAIRNPPPELAQAMATARGDFVYVRFSSTPIHSEVPRW
jgi:hypothetical protein